jgi:hypothetical protein
MSVADRPAGLLPLAVLALRLIRRIVESAHQRAKDLLTEHRESLGTISEVLVKRETIEKADRMLRPPAMDTTTHSQTAMTFRYSGNENTTASTDAGHAGAGSCRRQPRTHRPPHRGDCPMRGTRRQIGGTGSPAGIGAA